MNTAVQKKARIQWIDFMKAIAIFAVLADHTYGMLHTNLKISYGSFFSVTLFILISGVTSYTSFWRRKDVPYSEDLKRKLKAILIPYGIATAVYGIIAIRYFDLMSFINSFFNFSSALPFYFVLVFVQLIFISRPFCMIVNAIRESKRTGGQKFLIHFIISVLLLIAAAVFTKYTYMLNIYVGGKFLFGGTYLFVFYLGHIIGSYADRVYFSAKCINNTHIYMCVCILIVCSILAAVTLENMLTKGSFFGDTPLFGGDFNPPESRQMLYSFSVFGMLLSVNWLIDRVGFKPLIFVRNIIAWFGKYSLYIFLFHMAVLNILNQSSIPIWCADHIWIKRFIYIGIIIGTCVIIGIIIERILKHGKEDFGKLLIWIRK